MATPTREQIIRQIRGLSDANAGKPPGVERFESATGIKQAVWRGRYWARWSDAVRDAGYEPNAWQRRKLSDDDLLAILAAETRTLGHLPTAAELKLKRQTDLNLPNEKVFANRFGRREALIEKLLIFTDTRPELSDVAAICATLVAVDRSTGRTDQEAKIVTGAIYLIRMGEFYKIGKTNDPGRRLYEIGLRLPEQHEVLHVIETDDPSGIEAYWHRRFAALRANGEWFRLSTSDVAAMLRRKYQ